MKVSCISEYISLSKNYVKWNGPSDIVPVFEKWDGALPSRVSWNMIVNDGTWALELTGVFFVFFFKAFCCQHALKSYF